MSEEQLSQDKVYTIMLVLFWILPTTALDVEAWHSNVLLYSSHLVSLRYDAKLHALLL